MNKLTLRNAEYESSSYKRTVIRPLGNCLCDAAATPTYKMNDIPGIYTFLSLT